MWRAGRFAIGIAITLAVGAAVTGAAAANVKHAGGIAYVAKGYPSQPTGTSRLHANCPHGTNVLGGGADNNGDYGTTSIPHSYPIDGKDADKKPDDGWEVGTFGAGTTWDWTVYATCADRKVTYVTKSFKADPMTLTNKSVPCPAGLNIVGGGESASFKLNQNSAFPIPGQWAIFEDSYESGKVPFKGYAICAKFSTAIVMDGTNVGTGTAGGASPACATHRFVVAGGTSNGGGHGQASVHIAYPFGPSAAPADGWSSRTNNFGSTMSVNVQAVCVKHL